VASGNGLPASTARGHFRHPVQVAPDERFGKEDDVTAGQVDGLVRRSVVRRGGVAEAPVRAVDIRHGQVEDDERGDGRGRARAARKRRRWRVRPAPRRLRCGRTAGGRGGKPAPPREQHATIQPAAGEYGERWSESPAAKPGQPPPASVLAPDLDLDPAWRGRRRPATVRSRRPPRRTEELAQHARRPVVIGDAGDGVRALLLLLELQVLVRRPLFFTSPRS